MHKSGNVDVTLCLRVRHPSSCTLTSIDQRRAREAYSERQVLERTHSGAEECGRVRGGEGVGTAKSVGHCTVARPTWEYTRASDRVGGDFGPARPSSCTLTSIDQRRARGACSERHVVKGTHSGAEGCRRVVGEGGGVSEGTAKSDGTLRRRQTVSI
jgi:hypothetical protein